MTTAYEEGKALIESKRERGDLENVEGKEKLILQRGLDFINQFTVQTEGLDRKNGRVLESIELDTSYLSFEKGEKEGRYIIKGDIRTLETFETEEGMVIEEKFLPLYLRMDKNENTYYITEYESQDGILENLINKSIQSVKLGEPYTFYKESELFDSQEDLIQAQEKSMLEALETISQGRETEWPEVLQ